jgi:methionine-rich copper-binding protein CopC
VNRFKIATLAGAVAALSVFAGQADAHARLVSATPATGATVAAPRSISLTFSERMAPAFSGFDVANAQGTVIPVQARVSKDGKTLSGAPRTALAAGAYTVNWRVASPDGHRMTGSTTFIVR